MKTRRKKDLSLHSLIITLKSFSPFEIDCFEEMISSKYFNNQRTLSRLFAEIKKHYPEFSSTGFTREDLFDKVNPGKPYNDMIFRKYMSNLTKLAEEFLILSDNKEHDDRKLTSLLDQYERRNLIGHFNRLIDKTETCGESKSKIKNESFYYKHYREELKSGISIRSSNLELLKPNLLKSHVYLLMHVLMTCTVYGNMMIVNRKSFKDTEAVNIFEEFFELFDLVKYLENSEYLTETEKLFVRLCKQDILLMKDPFAKPKLVDMKRTLLEACPHLNKNLVYTFFSHLNIFYLLNIHEEVHDYSSELFGNYKFMIENDLYEAGGRPYINFSEYRTILLTSLKLGETEWAEELIEKFRSCHGTDINENIYNYSFAVLYFETGNYNKAMEKLSKLRIDNFILKFDSDVFHMIVYYELDYLDSALSVADSFKYFVRSNELLAGDLIKSQNEFIRFFKYLVKHKYSEAEKYEHLRIMGELKQSKGLRRKSWLIGKMKEVKTK